MTLFYQSFAFLLGLYLGFRLSLPPEALLAAMGAGIVALLLSWPRPSRRLLLLCLLAFLVGMLRAPGPPLYGPQDLAFYNDRNLTIEGVVAAEPEAGDRTRRVRLAAEAVEAEGRRQGVAGAAQLTLPRYPEYHYGDRLRVKGRLERPLPWGDFDYEEYLTRQGIASVMSYPQVKLMESGQGWLPLAWLYQGRAELGRALSQALPEPQASLAQGILLGLRRTIPQELVDAFAITGTTHILAISGQNLTLVAALLLSAGTWLWGRRRAAYFWAALGGIWLYALLAGAAPPVIRAAVMGSLALLAGLAGRQFSAPIALGVAAAVMTGLEPQLLWDVGFQLSFLAMAGLVALPSFKNPIAAVLVATLGATLATLGVVALNFHRLPLVAAPATLMALPALPGIMATSALTALGGLASPALGQALGWLAWPWLSYLIWIVEGWAQLPAWELGAVSDAAIWAYYGALGLGLLLAHQRSKTRPDEGLLARLSTWFPGPTLPRPRAAFWLIAPLAMAVSLWGVSLLGQPSGLLRVAFLDVGQGDAILIQTPSGVKVLIDGGPSPQLLAQRLGEQLPFWERSIDLVILSHPQADHLTGLTEVVSRYAVGQVVEATGATSPLYQEWQRLLAQRQIPQVRVQAGSTIEVGDGLRLQVLHPQALPSTLSEGEINEASVVLRLELGEVSFLFTGDIGERGQAELLRRGTELSATVLKVPHHGSAASLSAEFLAAVSPQVAIISVGKDNPFGHPHPDTLSRLGGRPLWHTDERGTIEVSTDGTRLWLRSQR